MLLLSEHGFSVISKRALSRNRLLGHVPQKDFASNVMDQTELLHNVRRRGRDCWLCRITYEMAMSHQQPFLFFPTHLIFLTWISCPSAS